MIQTIQHQMNRFNSPRQSLLTTTITGVCASFLLNFADETCYLKKKERKEKEKETTTKSAALDVVSDSLFVGGFEAADMCGCDPGRR